MIMQWIGSPNYDSNRRPIKRVIIHWIVGNLAASDAVFQSTERGTSAHYAIEDQTIHQYVKEENVAYHAGNYVINQESIGIEHSASPDRPASEETYKTSAKLISLICQKYGIPIDREHIEPHNKYKATQCPGTMDIDKLIELAKQTDEPDYKKLYEELREKYDIDIAARDNQIRERDEEIKLLRTQLEECKNQPPKEVRIEVPVENTTVSVETENASANSGTPSEEVLPPPPIQENTSSLGQTEPFTVVSQEIINWFRELWKSLRKSVGL